MLQLADGSGEWTYPQGTIAENMIMSLQYRLPAGITCERCILQVLTRSSLHPVLPVARHAGLEYDISMGLEQLAALARICLGLTAATFSSPLPDRPPVKHTICHDI